MQMTRYYWAGSALIAISLLSWGGWTIWNKSRTWVLVDNTPISATQGYQFRTAEFAINLNARYDIEVVIADRFKRHDPMHRLDDEEACSLGVQDYPRCTTAPILRATWRLLRNGAAIREGDSDNHVGYGGYATSEIERSIGTFRVPEGRGYQIEVDVIKGDERLNSMRPRLSVGVSDPIIESTLVLSYFLNRLCPCLALLGGLIIVGPLIIPRRRVAQIPGSEL